MYFGARLQLLLLTIAQMKCLQHSLPEEQGGSWRVEGSNFALKQVKRYSILSKANRTLFQLNTRGKMLMPPGINRIFIDVGAHTCTEFFQDLSRMEDLFVIAFEPTPSTFSEHAQRCSHERLLLLPFAISMEDGFTEFHKYRFSECNTLAKVAMSVKKVRQLQMESRGTPLYKAFGKWKRLRQCMDPVGSDLVPTISLESFFRFLPLDVDFLKIDAQGLDVQVVESLKSQASHVKRLVIETQDLNASDKKFASLKLYENTVLLPDAQPRLQALGFELEKCDTNNFLVKEVNCYFVRSPGGKGSSSGPIRFLGNTG